MEHILDNPVLSEPTTGNSSMGTGTEAAKYYLPVVSPFARVQDYTPDNF
ncbi:MULTISPECIES: hypothetical protein [Mucilaginibacter]|uniref:Uncharacterized protein n=1 Tax=Mucilaginibacter rubeus TaxID=2027860 RepID=A0ABX7UDY0_9SPHI|nr:MULTISPECIES: hypothetical protein [Mucilaginibacter]QTE44390.1 hypothetical protein J3L19_03180 [Mucilaginibacter rubeus]QTE50989.1 hypothetical protein J3L21_03155 [Mucilaginibacter rubeus]QTE56073.1 hypothetical protein J3L23_28395 [Mucilaginibacter rubeus]QTE64463.1 hypothetical protein J3L22_05430 [Mucilaginibacter rubeus]QTF63223.1 hypothetical protein J3L20_05115 [Mucilaginibacter rubeus]